MFNSNILSIAEKGCDYSNCLRSVLFGFSGSGKTAFLNKMTGNENLYISQPNATNLTQNSQGVVIQFFDKELLMIDTPGIQSNIFNGKLRYAMETYLNPGPHIFIIVISTLYRYTSQQIRVFNNLKTFYDNDTGKHSIILFTGLDELTFTLDEYINSDRTGSLNELINACNNNYLGVSNRWAQDSREMIEFKETLNRMIDSILRLNSYHFFDSPRSIRIFKN